MAPAAASNDRHCDFQIESYRLNTHWPAAGFMDAGKRYFRKLALEYCAAKMPSGVRGRGGLAPDRSVSVAQAPRDIDIHANVLRKCLKVFGSDPNHGQWTTENFATPLKTERIGCNAYRSRDVAKAFDMRIELISQALAECMRLRKFPGFVDSVCEGRHDAQVLGGKNHSVLLSQRH